MAKKPSTIVVPAKPVAAKPVAAKPVAVPVLAAIAAALGKTAPTPADVEAAALAEKNAATLKLFGDTFAAFPAVVAGVDAIGREAQKFEVITKSHTERMCALVAAVYVSADWLTWPIHSLIGKYIAVKFGEWARAQYSAALRMHCETGQKLGHKDYLYPTAGHGSGNASKGVSPARKQAKFARAVDKVVAAMVEFHATIVVDAPSVAIWTRIMKDLRDVQALAKQESDNAKLKRTA
jgi:hypothetical protein